jgi:hypothetical protein
MHKADIQEFKLDYFTHMFWCNVESQAHWKFFEQDIEAPINRAMVPERAFMKKADIDKAKKFIRDALLAARPAVPPDVMLEGLLCLYNTLEHPDAATMHPEIQSAARKIWNARPKNFYMSGRREKFQISKCFTALGMPEEAVEALE